MNFYDRNIVISARNLRKKGLSVKDISTRLETSKANIFRWCFDIESKDLAHLKSREIKNDLKKKGEELIKNFDLDTKTAKILASLLYWCEGYKYPACNYIGFSNSDINLVKTFLKLFRVGFKPDEKKFRCHLQLHIGHDKRIITKFWSKSLSIPEKQFTKPTITSPLNKMKRIGYKGTCTIRYYDFKKFNEMVGIYESFSKKIIMEE